MEMKKGVSVMALSVLGVLASCMEEMEGYNATKQIEQEAPFIAAYVMNDPKMEGAKLDTPTGIWYVVENPGEGDYPYVKWPYAEVIYRGELLDGTVFDSMENQHPLQSNLLYMPEAWQIAFKPKRYNGLVEEGLQEGAKIKIVTPSPHAYRDRSMQQVPAHSPLFFSIEVLKLSEDDFD